MHIETLHLHLPNQPLERTAARRVFILQMINAPSVVTTLACGGGRSAWSR